MVEFLRHDYGWFDPHQPVREVCWPHFDLLFVHAGAVRMRVGRKQIEMRGPQALLIFPHTPFSPTALGEACRASIQHFGISHGHRSKVFAPIARKPAGCRLFPNEESRAVEIDVHRALALAKLRQTAAVREVRLAMLQVILAGLQGFSLGSGTRRDSIVLRAEQWARARLGEAIDVPAMAEALGEGYAAFRARFRREAGVSPARFLRDLRMRAAQQLLLETELPVKQIARQVGYPELPHLYRTFVAHSGTTPAAYRAAGRRFA